MGTIPALPGCFPKDGNQWRTAMSDTLSVYRSELKYIMNYADAARLKGKLDAFLRTDVHGEDGVYRVKSLYYDTPGSRDFFDKVNGLKTRQKLRLRIYDEDQPAARLELKSKEGDRQHKTGLEVTRADASILMKGVYSPLFRYPGEDAMRLYAMLAIDGYRPAVIVEYDRAAYSYPAFDVRLTFDSRVRSCETNLNLYEKQLPWNPVFTDAVILEVKFNRHLPSFVRKILQPYRLNQTSFSKYCAGRQLAGSFLI